MGDEHTGQGGCLQAIPWLVVMRGSSKQCMQQLAHRLELQAGLAPQPLAGPRCYLAPEAAEGGKLPCLLADVGQLPACLPEADGSDGPGPGGQAWRGQGWPSGRCAAPGRKHSTAVAPVGVCQTRASMMGQADVGPWVTGPCAASWTSGP